MIVDIEGTNLPGRRCHPDASGQEYTNIHVGLGMTRDPGELVPGDAPAARWRIEVRTSRGADGAVDFHGPYVQGPRGDRFLYLNWGTVAAGGSFHMFRRAKLILSAVEPALVEQVLRESATLACTVNLTDAKGNPSCARMRPPDIAWRLTPGIPTLPVRQL